MARYRGPRVKIVRRLGELPGLTTKVPNRNYGPGQHGQTAATKKLTQFRVRLQAVSYTHLTLPTTPYV